MSAPSAGWAREAYCYVTTTGRRTGRPHTVEIWFAAHESAIFIISSPTADWVRNAQADPAVTVRIGERTFRGRARIVTSEHELALARAMLPEKYRSWEGGLEEWAAESLPVAIDLEPGPA